MICHLDNAGHNILAIFTVFQHRFDSPQVRRGFLSTSKLSIFVTLGATKILTNYDQILPANIENIVKNLELGKDTIKSSASPSERNFY